MSGEIFQIKDEPEEGEPIVKESSDSSIYLADLPENMDEVIALATKGEENLTGEEALKVASTILKGKIDDLNAKLEASSASSDETLLNWSGPTLNDKALKLVVKILKKRLEANEKKFRRVIEDRVREGLFKGDEWDREKAELINIFVANPLTRELNRLENLMKTVKALDADEAAVAEALRPEMERVTAEEEEAVAVAEEPAEKDIYKERAEAAAKKRRELEKYK